MPRPKEFDVEATLDRAVELFRSKGYSATSVQDLVDTLGINRASIYDTFGSKEELFSKAVQRYTSQVEEGRSSLAANEPSPRLALIKFIRGTAEWALNDRQRCGCLVANSCVELKEFSPATSKQVSSGMKASLAFVRELAERAQQLGELPPALTAEVVASQALSHAVSIPLLVKAGMPAESVRAVVEGFEKFLSN
jgi:TetR/AcrR family transcriptional regulator, transcriptional repressor for nem operon